LENHTYTNCSQIYHANLDQNLIYSYKALSNTFDDIAQVFIGTSSKSIANLQEMLLTGEMLENYKYFIDTMDQILQQIEIKSDKLGEIPYFVKLREFAE
jgi:endoglucanase Acf2